ncbi:hypothetical protein EOD29_22900 [Mesorhizobium sp. M1A.T.Ca.IN.004.03.1.1]|uniref:hypothetical protein n=1 Tax=Mesorhizobium sp. M1A.T.Ca.IN.004.03.1.1 TaxID=2496795 RepID=UPI000FCA1CEA|nr:hypothetical protein [Mesorhizobium sp. M1A.T.Ca.IN.004.03.1.1]RUV41407.1 hypothetical protein EOD29_22900 [Mesorhizobium sp. M1A.T.Ca.IN.004.03.1.1]
MMPGVAAQPLTRRQTRPGWVPWDAIAFLDFVNGRYFAGSAQRAIATLLGGDFDPGAISASGMRITPSNGNRPKAIGALFCDMAAAVETGGTVVFKFESAIDPSGFLMFIADGPNLDLADEAIIVAVGELNDNWDLLIDDSVTGAGTHKIALTLARDVGGGDFEYALCHDGNSALTQTVSYVSHALPVDTILIGHDGVGTGNSLNDIYIRSITLYPPKLPADLPTIETVWDLDFLTEVYTKDDSTVALADIIDKPERVGASGLEIVADPDPDGYVLAAGDLLADFVSLDWTVVIEWEELSSTSFSEILVLQDLADGAHSLWLENAMGSGSPNLNVAEDAIIGRDLVDETLYGAGAHKLALTRTASRIAISVDGGAAIVNTTPETSGNPIDTAGFGGFPGYGTVNGFYVRSFRLMPPVADSLLPSLST